MRYLLLTALFFLSLYCQSQKLSDSILIEFSKGNLMSEIMAKPIFKRNQLFSDSGRAAKIDFGVRLYHDDFNNLYEKEIMSAEEPRYILRAYTIHDFVFMREIEEERYFARNDTFQYTTLLSIADKRRTKWYVRQHNNKYHSSWKIRDFTNKKAEFGIYGFDCGGPFSDILKSKDGYAFAKLVKGNDTNKLRELASSFYSSDRAVGTAGLYFLQLRGIKLSQTLLDLIYTNRTSELMLNWCMSDVFGIDKMNKVLDDEHLKWIYDMFVEQHMF